MPKPNPYRPYQPDPAQMALTPAVSGNDINGLKNPDPHPPRLVYWAPDPDQIPHGEMQRWFYTVQPDAPALLAERAARQTILEAPLPEVAAEQVTRAPREWTTLLDGFVEAGLCEKTGVAEMQDEWCYEGRSVSQSRVIMLGVRHDYARLSQAPEVEAGAEVIRQYGRAAHAAKQAAGWLRQEGWAAEPVTGPMTGPMTGDFTLIPPALACGFGELGKHGSIIDRDLGANFRLSAVLTDAPFAPTPPREHGIDAFCANCRICEDACPPEAIFAEKQQVRGASKWYVNFDKCLPFFNERHDCEICFAVRPSTKRPDIGSEAPYAQRLKPERSIGVGHADVRRSQL